MPPRAPRWTLPLVRAAFSIALAYSYTFNIRNVEYYWYPLWNHVLLDLLPPGRPDLVVAPQFLLWIDPSVRTEKAEDPESGEGQSDSDSHSDTDESDASDVDDKDFEALPTLSTRTTAATSEASAQLVDFAIAQLVMQPEDPAAPPTDPDGFKPHWVIADREIPVLVEIKKFTSRHHPETFSVWELQSGFFEAKEQLVRGAAHIFAQTDAQEVRVIAAVGPWWTNRILKRNPDAQPTRLSDEDLQYYLKEGKLNSRTRKPKKVLDVETLVEKEPYQKWNVPRRLGTAESDKRLRTITKHLQSLDNPEEIKKDLEKQEGCCIM